MVLAIRVCFQADKRHTPRRRPSFHTFCERRNLTPVGAYTALSPSGVLPAPIFSGRGQGSHPPHLAGNVIGVSQRL